MFNKRLQHDFEIPNAGLHRVYLLEESDTVVTWPVIKGQGEPVRLSFGNRNNSIYTPVLPGTLTWRIVIQNQAARDAIDAVFESIEGDYRVEFYQVEGGVTENLIWRGDLLLDQYNEDLRGFPGFVELIANDLASLQGKNYLHTDGFVHTGRETQLQIIKNCVQLLGYDLGFACSDAIYEDTMDGDPLTDDPMLQAYCDNAWYYPVDQFLQTRLMSAWDVMSSILISKACRIRQWGGRWYVEQILEGVAPIPLPDSNFEVLIGGQQGLFRVVDGATTPISEVQNLAYDTTGMRFVSYDENEGFIAVDNNQMRIFNKDYTSRLIFTLGDFLALSKPWVAWDGYLYLIGRKVSDTDVLVVYRIEIETAQYVRKEQEIYNAGASISVASICLDNQGRVFGSVSKTMFELDYQSLDIIQQRTLTGDFPFYAVTPGDPGFVYYSRTSSGSSLGLYKISTADLATVWSTLSEAGVIRDVIYNEGKVFLVGEPNNKGLYVYDQEGTQLFFSETAANINLRTAVDTFGDIYLLHTTSGTNVNRLKKFSGTDYSLIWDKDPYISSTVAVTDFDVHPGRVAILNQFSPRPTLPDIDVPVVSEGTFTYGAGASISSITGDIPGDQRTGSWLIAVLMHRNATEAGITPPAGWGLIVSQKTTTENSATNQYVSMYRFIDDGSLGSDVTFNSAVSARMGLCILRVHRITDGALGYGKIIVDTYSSTGEDPGQELVPSLNVTNSLNAAIVADTCLFSGASSRFKWNGGWQPKDLQALGDNRRLGVASKRLEAGQSVPNVIEHVGVASHDSAQILLMIEVGGAAEPPTPENAIPHITLTATPADGRVLLEWTQDAHPDVDVYYIRQDGAPLIACPNGLTVKEYLVTGLSPGEYEFQIWAINDPCGTEIAVRKSPVVGVTVHGYDLITETGTWDWAAAGSPATVDVLIVAGGGGGGGFDSFNNGAGGGGAGGVRVLSGFAVAGDVAVTVGSGGAGGNAGKGAEGGASSFGGQSCAGGGGGAGYNGATFESAGNGGSGGGGAGAGSGSSVGGTGTSGQGNNGGTVTGGGAERPAGGGGGHTEAGASIAANENGGKGGDGSLLSTLGFSDATGAPASVGGGGGGGRNGGTAGDGGVGGGGAGNSAGNGNNATANTGGGGGGSGGAGTIGGNGGSGIVIVKYVS